MYRYHAIDRNRNTRRLSVPVVISDEEESDSDEMETWKKFAHRVCHSTHSPISEADLILHERAVCPSSRAISERWRWLHAAQPASDRALATLDEPLAAMRTPARQCVVIRNFV